MKNLKEEVLSTLKDMFLAMTIVVSALAAIAIIVFSLGNTIIYFSGEKLKYAEKELQNQLLVAQHEARIKRIHNDVEVELNTIKMNNLREMAEFEQENILKKELIEAERARDIAKLRLEEELYKDVYKGRDELDCRVIEDNEKVKLTCITYIENTEHPSPDFKPIRNID